MANYDEFKNNTLKRAVSSTIRGTPLDRGVKDGWFPINPCICVTEPCPCDKLDDLIVWLPPNTPGRRTSVTASGDDVFSYDVAPNAEVLVETMIPMRLGQLRQLKAWSEQRDTPPGRLYKKAAKGKVGAAGAAAAAFEVGYAIGEKIDEAFGISDDVSDWLAENIPWPF